MAFDVEVPLAQILSQSDEIKLISGPNKNVIIRSVAPPELTQEGSLVFVSKPEQLALAIRLKARSIVALNSISTSECPENITLLTVPNIQKAMSLILPLFDTKQKRFPAVGDALESASKYAFIHPSAKIHENVTICPFAVIGEGAVVESYSIIGPHCNIEPFAQIGSNTLLHNSVHIGSHCQVGSYCEIHPHTTIGSDGFGFYTLTSGSQKGEQRKVPQLGNVIIEDHVEIGGNCSIDRATLTSTIIRRGTKIDNLVHIAHNCDIGENSLIAAGFMMAGSSQVGKQFITGGNSVVTSHVKITDNVTLAGRSTVTNNVESPGVYGGYPLEPIRSALKTIANLSQLTQMRKQINKILKHLDLKDD